MIAFMKKIVTLLLFSFLIGLFDASAQLPGIRREGQTVYVDQVDNSTMIICVGGAAGVLGAALLIYGMCHDSAVDDSESDLSKAEKDKEKFGRAYYCVSTVTTVLGVLACLYGVYDKCRNKLPLLIMNNRGVSADGRQIAWNELVDVRKSVRSETVEYGNYGIQADRTATGVSVTVTKPISVTHSTEYVDLTKMRGLLEMFSQHGDISIPAGQLPIPADTLVQLIRSEKARRGYGGC